MIDVFKHGFKIEARSPQGESEQITPHTLETCVRASLESLFDNSSVMWHMEMRDNCKSAYLTLNSSPSVTICVDLPDSRISGTYSVFGIDTIHHRLVLRNLDRSTLTSGIKYVFNELVKKADKAIDDYHEQMQRSLINLKSMVKS
jgi:hypothetical protein